MPAGVPCERRLGKFIRLISRLIPRPASGAVQKQPSYEGVRRDGAHLYPAFPYDHFARVAPDDLRAIYAFLMTREPVRAEPRRP